ncbi:MAG: hypothetical protein EBV76_08410, partial [Gammaproteobacteria bacterium]|nr:hypothetical protein [Gammaproteobacteria bacterium]
MGLGVVMVSLDRAFVVSVSSVLSSASVVAVADQAIPATSAELTEVVILGSRPIAESDAAALRVQKNSDNLVAVAAADAVGRLP